MPAWPDDDDVPYSVLTVRLSDDAPFISTVRESVGEVCFDIEVPLCRVEETDSPDDGRILRIAVQGDENDAVLVAQCMAEEFDWFRPSSSKVLTTNHPAEFDCSEVWPEDALNATMVDIGMQRYELTFAVPGWFPFTLLGSIVQDSVLGVGTAAKLDDDAVAGVGMDKTTPGFPTVHIWCTGQAVAAFADEGLPELVEECIQYVADEVILRRWLERTVKDAGHLC